MRLSRKHIALPLLVSLAALVACGDKTEGSNAGGNGGLGGPSGGGTDGGASGGRSGSSSALAGDGGGSLDACSAFSEEAFKTCTATYLTDGADDEAGGVAIGTDGAVIYAGTLRADDYGLSPSVLLAGGNAGILRLSPDGRKPLSVARLGGRVTDVAINAVTGAIAASGDFGVALLDPSGAVLGFSATLAELATEVAIGTDGTVAALTGKSLAVFDPKGKALFTGNLSGTLHDVAIDAASQTVFVTGFKQDDGGGCTQLQVPFIRSFAYDGSKKWTAYDFTHEEVAAVDECADSRGLALGMGLDGKLYYAGRSDGGNTVHNRLPRDLSKSAPNVKFDKYTDPYNMNGAASVTYFARFDPLTGTLERGQKYVVRASADKGNTMRPTAITATASGTVVVTGASACCIPGAEAKMVDGQLAMPKYAGGGFVLIVPADFASRSLWTVFRGPTGDNESPVSVATDGKAMAVLMQQRPLMKDGVVTPTTDISLITSNALASKPGGGGGDAYLAVWRAP